MAPAPHHTVRSEIVDELDLDGFPVRGYRDEEYLSAVLDAGFDVEELARAHDVTPRTIYNAMDEHSLSRPHPPTTGAARALWQADASVVSE